MCSDLKKKLNMIKVAPRYMKVIILQKKRKQLILQTKQKFSLNGLRTICKCLNEFNKYFLDESIVTVIFYFVFIFYSLW